MCDPQPDVLVRHYFSHWESFPHQHIRHLPEVAIKLRVILLDDEYNLLRSFRHSINDDSYLLQPCFTTEVHQHDLCIRLYKSCQLRVQQHILPAIQVLPRLPPCRWVRSPKTQIVPVCSLPQTFKAVAVSQGRLNVCI